MKEAFTYMFKDDKFWIKGLSYLTLIFIANLLLNYAQTLLPPCPKCAPPLPWEYWASYISGTLINLIPLGYMFACIKTIIDQEENPVLPFVNPIKNFIKGFKYSISMLIFVVPLIIVTMLLLAGIAGLKLGSVIGITLSTILLLAVITIVGCLFVGFNWMFANKDSLLTFYRFKKVFEVISSGKRKYFGHIAMILVVFIINMLLESGFGFTARIANLGTIPGLLIVGLLAALTGTYTVFVICHLTANAVKRELIETV